MSKQFLTRDGSVAAISDVAFSVPQGTFFTLLGPSGCGKTTTMRCIAGLERPDSGMIRFAGKTMYDREAATFVPTAKRPIGMVFQSYAIWPHMTVFENVAYPLRVQRIGKALLTTRVNEVLELVGLPGEAQRRAPQLSGGQQQRVALARALVAQPDLLILDEPLSNLDAALRVQMRAELKKLQAELKLTTLYVTHDQQEALAMSDEIAVMRGGRIVQAGSPKEIYDRPATRFVAEFVGATNLVSGKTNKSVVAGSNLIETDLGPVAAMATESRADSAGDVLLSIRPESIALGDEVPDRPIGRISEVAFLGDAVDYVVQVGTQRLRVRRSSIEADRAVGSAVSVTVSERGCAVLADDPSRHVTVG